jgi:uncharacterized protein YggE
MKQIQTIVNTVLACALIFLLALTGLPSFNAHAIETTPTPQAAPPQTTTCDLARTVQVTGTAVVNVAPDRALIKLGVQTNGRSAKDAQARNAATISKITFELKLLGVEAKDIATDWYTLQPVYEDYEDLRINGYRIYNVIEVTVRDVKQTNDLIAAAFQAGANQVNDVQFYTSDLRKYRDQAREMAMTAATEKANDLAQAAGAGVSCVISINENSQSHFNGWGWWYGSSSNQNLWTQNSVQNVEPTGGETSTLDDGPTNAGQISIRAEVSAVFGLK